MKFVGWVLAVMFAICLAFSLTGGGGKTISEPMKIERVFYASPDIATVFVANGNTLVPKRLTTVFYGKITYIADVPANCSMYYVENGNSYEIHIHAAKDIQAGETTGKGAVKHGVVE